MTNAFPLEKLDYCNKIILAPMVRIGTLPTRLLALEYGADIVYSEELIDFRLLRCRRIENRVLDTVDYVDDDQNVVFRTCEKERGRVVLQVGTCDPERALRVAKMVEQDITSIDINMGCPKEFSLKGGMGAALLTKPETVEKILRTLVTGVSKTITCKIRVLPTVEETVALAKLIERTGVAALTVHGRTKEERPQHANRNSFIKAIAHAVSIPVIANGGSGEIVSHEDIEKFRQNAGAASVMVARQAESNCSIFRKEGFLPLDRVITDYLKYAIDYDNHVTNTKYCIQQMMGSLQDTDKGRTLLSAQEMDIICSLWNMDGYYRQKQEEFQQKAKKLRKLTSLEGEGLYPLKRQRQGDSDIWEMEAKFIRNLFHVDHLPKTTLLNWTRKKRIRQPKYETEQIEKSFKSVVSIENNKFSSTYLEKNKKNAEQASALVALYALNLVDATKIRSTDFCFGTCDMTDSSRSQNTATGLPAQSSCNFVATYEACPSTVECPQRRDDCCIPQSKIEDKGR